MRKRIAGLGVVHILETPDFKPGDLPPEGYLAWHAWAEVQRKARIKQVECGRCGLWRTPQELTGKMDSVDYKNKRGEVVKVETPVCTKCDKKKATP